MIEMIAKIFSVVAKPAVIIFRYFREEPKITLTIKGEGCAHGPSHLAGKLYFTWWRELVIHNDSAHLVRGIKLLRSFPKPWKMSRELPTRLEADQKMVIPFEAHIEEDHQELLNRFGKHMQDRLGEAVFPSIVANVVLELELTNQHGRTVYQYSTFKEDGTVKTEISSRRRTNVN